MIDPTSHTAAAVQGWAFVPAQESVAMADWIETYANAHRGKNTTPVRVDRPWLKSSSHTAAPRAASAESLARRSRLAERLGLRVE